MAIIRPCAIGHGVIFKSGAHPHCEPIRIAKCPSEIAILLHLAMIRIIFQAVALAIEPVTAEIKMRSTMQLR
jgi:hypothetical protein